MAAKNSHPHVDWSRLGKRSRAAINAGAAEEKAALGLTGRYKRVIVHRDGKAFEVKAPDVRGIRDELKLSQTSFAERFHLSLRTIQQWEQHRAMPDVIADAAAEIEREMERVRS